MRRLGSRGKGAESSFEYRRDIIRRPNPRNRAFYLVYPYTVSTLKSWLNSFLKQPCISGHMTGTDDATNQKQNRFNAEL
ncbi:hypothetical protein SODALDRAFT_105861 [Sodiomyces alkalinus F11]|uniref:Uncharacterized protein n=1 Tax=Sodiomyces alkalinus (strain CBS 110278 / VKM F-3762 / F11) TaxID=1314773 RepID=A0A3N2Q244_SODAK|nr:hypothetical protein SODALDRAFT_105861 [Sodiomyces alkalinus F11]ROT40841.1 hypothetical protein SODALDRAFT_105861 [Sodiomyces alkalinus F11]